MAGDVARPASNDDCKGWEDIERRRLTLKRCSRCLRDLPLEEFHIDRGHIDGRASACKACRAQWVASRKAERSKYNAQYYSRHRERRILEIHAYQKRHPEIQVKYRHQYRARKYQAHGSHTMEELVNIFIHQSGKCFYCGEQLMSSREGHFDHIIPLVRGGSDSADNIVFSCRPCNWSKHDRTLDEWCK